ncbi:salivary peroxidase/catechol oxidase-like [Hetaerina americana]|uniref:salivary peroxidase/catechol oxidase-like n=1 Tax=Hetaerina americana TaxID=62018 RepID=UPI003A7F2ACF
MARRAASTGMIASVVLCVMLTGVLAQQDDSFLAELVRQQNIQLQQQEIQGQLQDLALRHQAAKDSRNNEKVILLEGTREKLLDKLQELQEELERLLRGSRPPPRPQNVQRPRTTKKPIQERITPPPTRKPTQLPQTTPQQIPFQPQEEVFEIPEIQHQVTRAPPPCTTVDGAPGECRPLVQCLTFYLEITTLSRSRCPLEVGSDGSQRLGVCCQFKGQTVQFEQPLDRRNQGVLLPPPPPTVVIPQFTPQQLSSAANDALRKLQERVQATAFIFSQGVFVPPIQTAPSPVGIHQERFFALTPGGNTVQKAEEGQKNVEASVSLVEKFNLTPDQGTFALPTFSLLNTIIGDTCPRRPQCPSVNSGLQFTKYRSSDGSCNNLRNGEWGSSNIALQRILPPKYGDGVNSPRVGDGFSSAEANRDGGSDGLPGARVVSSQFAGASSPNADSSQEHTLILMQWGQFLDHDLTHTPISRGNNGGISCCQNGMAISHSSNLRHPDCYPIAIPGDDLFFKQFREKCMEFVRSLPAPRPQCNFGPREQMNQVTGYIDASNVYGSSLSSQRKLRELSGGRLKVQPSNPSKEVKQQRRRDKGLLPGNRDSCTDEFDEKECFDAGDVRANEQPELALMHTLWVREHNRVVGILSELHRGWSDEQLFQEARRIVAAEMQHITYNEFLPIILGKEYMDKFQLTPLVTSGGNHTRLYDADLNAGITNVFATAAFRFGHSLIQGNIQSFTKFGTVKHSLQLSKNQFSPFTLYEEGAVDDFVRGLSTQTCQRFDRFFTTELTNHLFQGDLQFGLDLVALNVQRGRDHGLAPYADWREVCGFKKPTRWEDLLEIMERETVEVLRGIYNSVSEIDLFIGGVGERGGLGGSSSLLGPTFTCLIGDQFARLRRGDRFYYEEGGQPSSFNERQLEQLRKTSLARILCDNSDDVAVMQPLAFYKATFLNQRVPCDSGAIPRVDLRAWGDENPAVA